MPQLSSKCWMLIMLGQLNNGPQTNQLSGRIFTHNLGNSPIIMYHYRRLDYSRDSKHCQSLRHLRLIKIKNFSTRQKPACHLHLISNHFQVIIQYWSISANITKSYTAKKLDSINYHMRHEKTAPFYFCNSFIKTLSIMTIFGTHILQ